jgi:hypothetical protein
MFTPTDARDEVQDTTGGVIFSIPGLAFPAGRVVAEEAKRFATSCGFQKLYLADSGVLSMYAVGRTTGMTVEAIHVKGGCVDLYITAMFEGYLLHQSGRRIGVHTLFEGDKSTDEKVAELFSEEQGPSAVHMLVLVGGDAWYTVRLFAQPHDSHTAL